MMSQRLSNWSRRGWMVVMLAVGALTAGCMHHPGGIAPSTKPLAPGGYTELGKVRGQDCVYHLLGLIPVTGGNEMRNASRMRYARNPWLTQWLRSRWTAIFNTSFCFLVRAPKCMERRWKQNRSLVEATHA